MSSLQFETPENVSIDYQPAGLGTRFVAWLVDQLFVWMLSFGLMFVFLLIGVSWAFVGSWFDDLEEGSVDAVLYFIAFVALVWGLGSFLYFGLSELLMRGQTPGKRMANIRVVKADGFALDATSVLVRNVFRVLDHIPAMWIVPVLSARGQRTGDMVAGTVVVSEEQEELSAVRSQLAGRSALESEFRFDAAALKRLESTDVQGIELLLNRWHSIAEPQRHTLASTMIQALTRKLAMEEPAVDQQQRFLEDLLSAELRRQQRGLA